jgi:hypothetical protein
MKKRLNHIKTAEYKYIDQEIHVSKKAIRSRSIVTVFLLMFGVVSVSEVQECCVLWSKD